MTQYFVPAEADERPDVAAFLLALADEKGYNQNVVLSIPGKGYLVPFDPEGQGTVDPSEVDYFNKAEKAPVMADGPESEQKKPEHKLTVEDGSVYIQALHDEVAAAPEEEPHSYREQVREWAKENGYDVGDRGAIKKAIIADYEKAHEEAAE